MDRDKNRDGEKGLRGGAQLKSKLDAPSVKSVEQSSFAGRFPCGSRKAEQSSFVNQESQSVGHTTKTSPSSPPFFTPRSLLRSAQRFSTLTHSESSSLSNEVNPVSSSLLPVVTQTGSKVRAGLTSLTPSPQPST